MNKLGYFWYDKIMWWWNESWSRWTCCVSDVLEEVIEQSIADDDRIDRAVEETEEPKWFDDDSDCEEGQWIPFVYMTVTLALLQHNCHRKNKTACRINAIARDWRTAAAGMYRTTKLCWIPKSGRRECARRLITPVKKRKKKTLMKDWILRECVHFSRES